MRLVRLLAARLLAGVIGAAALVSPHSAAAQQLKAFKDELFAYPAILSQDAGGAYRVVDYREARDIDARDEIPERRVRKKYVSTAIRKAQQDLTLDSEAGRIRHVAVGRTAGARFITIYLHGQGGSRKQGVDDLAFGGNFNRIKNLMAGNAGLYLSPDFSDFGSAGAAEITALIRHYAAGSPEARVFVACGSMGGALCWELARDERIAERLGGLLLLGSMWDEDFPASAAFRKRVPVFFGHGSRDTVFPVDRQEEFFRSILERSPEYPARFVRFESGTHGTPIRMSDWKETLNWMLAAGRRK
ncbi:MAG: phospholipase [Rhizobiaceae bacterium]|nr:phospholipase [Rhizobiaceae bacterium]